MISFLFFLFVFIFEGKEGGSDLKRLGRGDAGNGWFEAVRERGSWKGESGSGYHFFRIQIQTESSSSSFRLENRGDIMLTVECKRNALIADASNKRGNIYPAVSILI